MREVTYHPQMLTDLEWWRDHDPDTGRRVVELIEQTVVRPAAGDGRPKRIGSMRNLWSRRISQEHRLFYLLDGEIRFISCRGHDMPQHLYDAIRLQEWV